MRKLLLSVLVCFASLGAVAQVQEEASTLVVSLNDGTDYRFYIPDQAPWMSFSDGYATVSYYLVNEKDGRYDALEVERKNVKRIYFENGKTGIKTPAKEKAGVKFSLLQPGMVGVSGLNAGDVILVADLSGRSVMNRKAPASGQTVVDLSDYQRGVYVISINQRFTFKYMKP